MNPDTSDIQTAGAPAGALPFIYGFVDPSIFPTEQMRLAAEEALHLHGSTALSYGAERGCGILLSYLRTKLAREEGLYISDGSLMLTVGATGGLDAVCRLYTRPGDTVLVEAPTYHEALLVIRDYPVHIVPIAVDDEGLMVEDLADRLAQLISRGANPRLLYTIPTFQNPSGVTLSAGRRVALVELARQYDLMIVEDDVYRDLAYEGKPPPSLFELDTEHGGGAVTRLGSFSKILAPGLRVGWLLADPSHVARLCRSGLATAGGGANPFAAYVTAVFCQNGWLEPHVANLVQVYRQRRDVMLNALQTTMPTEVRWTRPAGGFFVWLTLPEPLKAQDVLTAAHQRSITFLTGETFHAEGGGERQIRLPFSYIAPAQMESGVGILAEIIKGAL